MVACAKCANDRIFLSVCYICIYVFIDFDYWKGNFKIVFFIFSEGKTPQQDSNHRENRQKKLFIWLLTSIEIIGACLK
jgi:hypothetical protein